MLTSEVPISETNGFKITWPVEPGRAYSVLASTNLVTDPLMPVAGPWTATVGQTSMCWTDTLSTGYVNRAYRIRLDPP